MKLRSPELTPALITVLMIALPALGWRLSRAPELDCELPVLAAAPALDSARVTPLTRVRPQQVNCQGHGRTLLGAAALLMGQRLDVNSASATDLAAVPGISRRLARLIVAEREARGPFDDLADLGRVAGIGPRRVQLLSPSLSAGP